MLTPPPGHLPSPLQAHTLHSSTSYTYNLSLSRFNEAATADVLSLSSSLRVPPYPAMHSGHKSRPLITNKRNEARRDGTRRTKATLVLVPEAVAGRLSRGSATQVPAVTLTHSGAGRGRAVKTTRVRVG